MSIAENISRIQERIAAACRRAGRETCSVTLVAVTKTFPAECVREALVCGITDIGESRIQEAQRKFLALDGALTGVRRHLIGHLQSNKAGKAVELFDLIQSIDSIAIAGEVDRQAEKRGKVQDCLIEVKVSGEEAKFGIAPAEVDGLLAGMEQLAHVRVRGIMAMAPYFDDPEAARPYFRKARELFDRLHSSHDLETLSLGMSHDFETAIEEGATMVRICTALFGTR
jgi:pyridoxal phosphate enzyme (YggS family)